jgi:hypothetical protein
VHIILWIIRQVIVNNESNARNIEQGTTYLYTIHARDRFGNDVKSDTYAMFTGAQQLSLIDLIANAAKDTFSWAVK